MVDGSQYYTGTASIASVDNRLLLFGAVERHMNIYISSIITNLFSVTLSAPLYAEQLTAVLCRCDGRTDDGTCYRQIDTGKGHRIETYNKACELSREFFYQYNRTIVYSLRTKEQKAIPHEPDGRLHTVDVVTYYLPFTIAENAKDGESSVEFWTPPWTSSASVKILTLYYQLDGTSYIEHYDPDVGKKVRTDYRRSDKTRTHTDLYDLKTGEIIARSFYRANGTKQRTDFYNRVTGNRDRTQYYELDGTTLLKAPSKIEP